MSYLMVFQASSIFSIFILCHFFFFFWFKLCKIVRWQNHLHKWLNILQSLLYKICKSDRPTLKFGRNPAHPPNYLPNHSAADMSLATLSGFRVFWYWSDSVWPVARQQQPHKLLFFAYLSLVLSASFSEG